MADPTDKEFEGGEKPWWSEMMRDITSAGLATYFMTEDSIRGYLKEKKFPKEVVNLLLEGVSRKKDDAYSVVAKEVAKFLSKVDLTKEVTRFLENHHIQCQAKISFEPKTGVKVEMKPPGDASDGSGAENV